MSAIVDPVFEAAADVGELIASVDVDEAVIATLQKWLPTYLRIVNEDKGLDYDFAVPAKASYLNVIEDDEWNDAGLPAVLVATAKTQGEPQVEGDGSYVAGWLTAVSVVVRGPTRAQTRRLASYYELAVRAALVQQEDLGGFAMGCRWISGGESRPLIDPLGKNRWLGEGASQYWVFTNCAVQRGVGPIVPLPSYTDLPTVGSITLGGLASDEIDLTPS